MMDNLILFVCCIISYDGLKHLEEPKIPILVEGTFVGHRQSPVMLSTILHVSHYLKLQKKTVMALQLKIEICNENRTPLVWTNHHLEHVISYLEKMKSKMTKNMVADQR